MPKFLHNYDWAMTDTAVMEYKGTDTVAVVPDGVVSLSCTTFEHTSHVTVIKLPESLRTISPTGSVCILCSSVRQLIITNADLYINLGYCGTNMPRLQQILIEDTDQLRVANARMLTRHPPLTDVQVFFPGINFDLCSPAACVQWCILFLMSRELYPNEARDVRQSFNTAYNTAFNSVITEVSLAVYERSPLCSAFAGYIKAVDTCCNAIVTELLHTFLRITANTVIPSHFIGYPSTICNGFSDAPVKPAGIMIRWR